jgi:hypothetical protein
MIRESLYWKTDLLRFATQLSRARTTAPPFSVKTYVMVEKAVLLGAFVIRRLADSHKLSDATASVMMRVTLVPSSGRRVTLINNHRLDELFDFTRPIRSRQSMAFLCNQAIHSYVFATFANPGGKRLSGVYVASDRQRNRALFAVPLVEWERAFRRAGNDHPTSISHAFDEKLGDYKVTVRTDSLRGRAARLHRTSSA